MNNIEEMIRQYRDIKDRKDEINKALKDLNAEEAYVQDLIIQKMQEEGLNKISCDGIGTASTKVDLYPQIKNMDEFMDYVFTHKAFDLIRKQVNAAPYREMISQGEEVEGVEAFEKIILNFRRK